MMKLTKKLNFRPYLRRTSLCKTQISIFLLNIRGRNQSYNFTINFCSHLWTIYMAFLESKGVKCRKDLPKKDKKRTKVLFPSWKQIRSWFLNVYQYLPQKCQMYTWNDDLCLLHTKKLRKHISMHTYEYGFYLGKIAENNWHFHGARRPRHKGNYSHRSLYFDTGIHVGKNWVQLSKLGKIRMLKDRTVPTDRYLRRHGYHVKAVHLSEDDGTFYASIITNQPLPINNFPKKSLHGSMGIDAGIVNEAITNFTDKNNRHIVFHNPSKDRKYKRLIKGVVDSDRQMSRCPLYYRKHQSYYTEHNKKRPKTTGYLRAQHKHQTRSRKAKNYLQEWRKQDAYNIVMLKPKSITIENLHIKGMMKNHKLAKAIARAGWGYFYKWLAWFCVKFGIQLRQVSRWYASTKLCCRCHKYNHKQFHGKLSDLEKRTLQCPYCGLIIDRDLNAAINLANAKHYKVWLYGAFRTKDEIQKIVKKNK